MANFTCIIKFSFKAKVLIFLLFEKFESSKFIVLSISESHSAMSNSFSPWNSAGKSNGVGSLPLLQRMFPTQESNSGLPHCRQILYQLSQKGGPRILEWVVYPYSSRPSWPGIEPGSPALQADSLPTELSGVIGIEKNTRLFTNNCNLLVA